MATKTPIKKRPAAKPLAAKKSAPKKAVAKKVTTKKKVVAKKAVTKKRGLRGFLERRKRGGITRKGVVIGAVVAVFAIAGFTGYSLWQNNSANAGGVCTLGRTGVKRIEGHAVKVTSATDTKNYDQCVSKEKAAAAAAAAKAAAAQKAAAAKVAAAAAAAKAAAAQAAAAAVAAQKAADAKTVANALAPYRGWTLQTNSYFGKGTAELLVCKVGNGTTVQVKGVMIVTKADPSTTVSVGIATWTDTAQGWTKNPSSAVGFNMSPLGHTYVSGYTTATTAMQAGLDAVIGNTGTDGPYVSSLANC